MQRGEIDGTESKRNKSDNAAMLWLWRRCWLCRMVSIGGYGYASALRCIFERMEVHGVLASSFWFGFDSRASPIVAHAPSAKQATPHSTWQQSIRGKMVPPPSTAAAAAAGGSAVSEEDNPYLRMRAEKIARNQAKLKSLGLLRPTPSATSSSSSARRRDRKSVV